MDELLLGIDIGTGSSKAVLATPAGQIVATATRAHSMSLPRPGWAEVDAEAVWWADLVALSRELLDDRPGVPIAGVCVSGVGPCLLLTDIANEPLRPAILYHVDSRATAEIAELTEYFGAEKILARCGKALSSQAVGPKMVWVQRHEPQVWQRARRWFNSNSWAVARLTGEYVLDHHSASQCDPLYDVLANDWNHDWVGHVAPDIDLPRLVWPSEVVGVVSAGAAARTGLAAGTPVVAGTIDAWAEAFSAGVRQPGDLMLMYGSTMFFVQVLESFRSSAALWTTTGVEPGSYTLAAGMSTSGSLVTWLAELTGGAPLAELVREAEATPPGADGLLMLPFLAGASTPIFDPRARGVIAGLSLRHTRGHLVRAAYEAVAFGIRHILEFLEDCCRDSGGSSGDHIARLVGVGGGTQSGLWTQIVSDVTGREQQFPEQTIGASYGDALLAAIGTGLVEPGTDWARITRRVEPDPGTRGLYDELYGAYRSLYPATREHAHLLTSLQQGLAPQR